MVRCGACRTQFNVGGPGRFACPSCGSLNVVRGPAGAEPPAPANASVPPPPRPPDPPSQRQVCPDCEFSFIVGDIDTAKCPNCGADVQVAQDF
jgi:rRNA maturation endonuclease Nob1